MSRKNWILTFPFPFSLIKDPMEVWERRPYKLFQITTLTFSREWCEYTSQLSYQKYQLEPWIFVNLNFNDFSLKWDNMWWKDPVQSDSYFKPLHLREE